MITVKEIVIAYLREHGLDGLCGDECGCPIDDLFPCFEGFGDCTAAHARVLGENEYVDDCGPGDTLYYSEDPKGGI